MPTAVNHGDRRPDTFDLFVECLRDLENMPDNHFAAVVSRMDFAGIDRLDFSAPRRYPFKPLEVAEKQVAAFVRRCPPGEAQGQNARVHLRRTFPVHVLNKPLFAPGVRLPNINARDAERASQAEIVLVPIGNVSVEQLPKWLRCPGASVYTVVMASIT